MCMHKLQPHAVLPYFDTAHRHLLAPYAPILLELTSQIDTDSSHQQVAAQFPTHYRVAPTLTYSCF
jgi:hypothetical protein